MITQLNICLPFHVQQVKEVVSISCHYDYLTWVMMSHGACPHLELHLPVLVSVLHQHLELLNCRRRKGDVCKGEVRVFVPQMPAGSTGTRVPATIIKLVHVP